MKLLSISTLSFLIFILFISNNTNAQELIPLEVNNTWKYLQKEIVNGKTIKIDTLTSKVEKEVTYNNKKWFYLIELGDEYIVRNDKDGQYELDTLSKQANGNYKEVLFLKNDKNLKHNSYVVFEDIEISIENATTPIKTKIGEFKCIKYLIRTLNGTDGLINELYIKPGVGLVRHKRIEKDTTSICDLIGYSVN